MQYAKILSMQHCNHQLYAIGGSQNAMNGTYRKFICVNYVNKWDILKILVPILS